MATVGITLDVANAQLQLYLEAERTVLGGQEFRFADGRGVTQANLKEIREGVTYWARQVSSLNPVLPIPLARGRVRRGFYIGR